jgi:hypothetical protein
VIWGLNNKNLKTGTPTKLCELAVEEQAQEFVDLQF